MRRAEAGFSLLEMLVALGVFSLAVLALLHLSGQNARSAVIVEEQALAGIVADTIAAESLLLDAAALAAAGEGSETAGDREWRWQRRIAATPVAGLQRIDIEVLAPGESRVVVATQVFRGVP
ncbi:MAG TPA: type II secretion system minor pseudopilin GspI [Arenimonas sp.]|nr:type II secretion system minor pseudopilin GspI [Arenimonas sp.]